MEKKIVTPFELGKWYKAKSTGGTRKLAYVDTNGPEFGFVNSRGALEWFYAPGTDDFDPTPVAPPADAVTVVLVKPETDVEIVARAIGAGLTWGVRHFGDTHVRVEFSQIATLAQTLRSLGF